MAHRKGFAIAAILAVAALAACAPTNSRTITPSGRSPTFSLQPTPPFFQPTPPFSQHPTPPSDASPTPSVPAGFQPSALSAISENEFWVLGTEACTSRCPPTILHSDDAGKTFRSIPGPQMVFLDSTVLDLRFADRLNGWAFGSQLWATHDGGAHWKQINLGMTVLQLEPGANGYVYAALEACSSTGSSPCVDKIMRTRSNSDAWSAISVPGRQTGLSVIGVHGDTLWTMVFAGSSGAEWISHDDGGSFVRGTMPCEPDLGGSFDPVSVSVIWAFCATGLSGGPWVSTNGGATFSAAGVGLGKFTNGAIVAALSARRAFVVGPGALNETTDGGGDYRLVPQLTGAAWPGFTDAQVGYVITRDWSSGAAGLWRTTNAGTDWSQVSLP
jgi:photosystem II stability/assembly factor-like uncharacterized protein